MQSSEYENQSRLPWLFGIALLILIALFVAPTTGWLARTQLSTLYDTPYAYITILNDLGVREAPGLDLKQNADAGGTPSKDLQNDYASELVAALSINASQNYNDVRLANLRHLLERFPQHRIALHAHILRYATMGAIRIGRDAEVEAYMSPPASARSRGASPYSNLTSKPSSPDALAAFDKDAIAGEQLDPDNAYFPLMRACGLFAAKRDTEALAEIARAEKMTRYSDYVFDEADARWHRLQRQGRPTVIQREATLMSLLFPHYAQMRAAARLTAYKATQAEVAGQVAEGFKIRHAMMHSASLMRVQSSTSIGSLVGIAMFAIQLGRPGSEQYGGLSPITWQTMNNEQRSRQRLDRYCAYMQRTGHPEEASWVNRQYKAGMDAKEILRQGIQQSPLGPNSLTRLFSAWTTSLLLLANTIEMLVLCGAMLALKKLGQDRGYIPMIVVGILCAVFFVFALQMRWAPAMSAIRDAMQSLSSDDSTAEKASEALNRLFSFPQLVRLSAIFFALIGPVLMLIGIGVERLIKRHAKTSILAVSLQRGGAVFALLLTLVYAGSLLNTLKQENTLNNAIVRMEQSGGKYAAEILGKTWPQ